MQRLPNLQKLTLRVYVDAIPFEYEYESSPALIFTFTPTAVEAVYGCLGGEDKIATVKFDCEGDKEYQGLFNKVGYHVFGTKEDGYYGSMVANHYDIEADFEGGIRDEFCGNCVSDEKSMDEIIAILIEMTPDVTLPGIHNEAISFRKVLEGLTNHEAIKPVMIER